MYSIFKQIVNAGHVSLSPLSHTRILLKHFACQKNLARGRAMNYHKSRHTFNDVAKLPHTLFRGRRNLFRNEIEKFYGDFYSP